MSEFDRLRIWEDEATRQRLAWYREVAANRRPAKFRICATIPTQVRPDAEEDDLWAELERLTPVFLARRQEVRDGAPLPSRAGRPTLLDLCLELAQRMLAHCNFCRWNCRVDRTRGTKFGACKLAAGTRVSAWFHHPGEELVYRGTNGSGTIFFTSCNMRCAFCQNGDISTDKDNGEVVDGRALAAMAWLRAPAQPVPLQQPKNSGNLGFVWFARHGFAQYLNRRRYVYSTEQEFRQDLLLPAILWMRSFAGLVHRQRGRADPAPTYASDGGRLDLGRWQGIFVYEHRTRPHERRLTLHLVGE